MAATPVAGTLMVMDNALTVIPALIPLHMMGAGGCFGGFLLLPILLILFAVLVGRGRLGRLVWRDGSGRRGYRGAWRPGPWTPDGSADVTQGGPAGPQSPADRARADALATLRDRLASGDITPEEYRERAAALDPR